MLAKRLARREAADAAARALVVTEEQAAAAATEAAAHRDTASAAIDAALAGEEARAARAAGIDVDGVASLPVSGSDHPVGDRDSGDGTTSGAGTGEGTGSRRSSGVSVGRRRSVAAFSEASEAPAVDPWANAGLDAEPDGTLAAGHGVPVEDSREAWDRWEDLPTALQYHPQVQAPKADRSSYRMLIRMTTYLDVQAHVHCRRVSHRWRAAADASMLRVVCMPRGMPAQSSIFTVALPAVATVRQLKVLVEARDRKKKLRSMMARNIRLYDAPDRRAILAKDDRLDEAMAAAGVEVDEASRSVGVIIDRA